jgi:proteic killer suppression protein
MSIQGFSDKSAEAIHNGRHPGEGFPADLIRAAQRALAKLEAATSLDDLKVPPGNRLHALSGGRQDQHAIRVNDQFRICFRWTTAGPAEVEITDYH